MSDEMTPERITAIEQKASGLKRTDDIIFLGDAFPELHSLLFEVTQSWRDLHDEIVTLRSQLEAQRWIPVSERLPEMSKAVHGLSEPVYVAWPHPDLGWVQSVTKWQFRFSCWQNGAEATHWRPLLSPPLTDTQSEGNKNET